MKHLSAVFFILLFAGSLRSQYKLVQVNDSLLSYPLAMESPDDGSGRIFIGQLHGKIMVYKNNKSFNSGKVFLDITNRAFQGNEVGLLGFTFHPHFNDSSYIYVNYIGTVNYVVSTIISRFTVSPKNPDSALASTEKILMTVVQPGWAHKGGKIEFGPDGYLYIPLGDGSDGGDPDNNAQNMQSLLGKISRIDVDLDVENVPPYGIPSDNPFINDTTGIRKEIFASGFRNPWQSFFDSYNGTFWVGDVGQDRYEEIDTVVKGGNYGWRIMEGLHRFADSTLDTSNLELPIWEYYHWDSNAGNCIIGGFVYHGLLFPKLRDKYIYADYATTRIWALTYDNGTVSNEQLVDKGTQPGLAISALYTDKVGNIYILSVYDGRIFKLDTMQLPDKVASDNLTNGFRLSRNIIDASHPLTTLYFDLPESERIALSFYNAEGVEVMQPQSHEFNSGENSLQFDTRSLKSGIYFLRIQTEKGIEMQKFIIL